MPAPVRHLTASMAVIDPERRLVLLVHHKASGLWQFPGGHLDPNEAPDETAVREVFEETGVQATLRGLRFDFPGMVGRALPHLVLEIPAPPKPERPGKPAEAAHSHIDLLYLGTTDSSGIVSAQEAEVHGARWVPVHGLDGLDARAEVATVAAQALAALR